jgi:two-component system NarL family response regulator
MTINPVAKVAIVDDKHVIIKERDIKVLNLMAQGVTDKAIADGLSINHQTLKNYIYMALYAKLGAVNRTHAVVIAIRNNIIKA